VDLKDYIRKVSTQTQRYQQDLLDQNRRLEVAAAEALAERAELLRRIAWLEEQVAHQRAERAQLVTRKAEIEAENLRLAALFGQVQHKNGELANLYVASYRFLETVRRSEVLQVIEEVVAALIGCEHFIVFELDRERQVLRPIKAVGVDAGLWAEIALGAGTIGAAVLSGEQWVRGRGSETSLRGESDLTAVIPLRVEGTPIGAIALFELLVQKVGLEELDLKLIELLAVQAATALHCATLHERDLASRAAR